jgi:PAS domain S-box-containing protein
MHKARRSRKLETPDSLQKTSLQPSANSAAASPVFRALLESLETGVAQTTPEGRILYANPRFAEILGRPRKIPVDSKLTDFIAPHSWPSLSEALAQGAEISVQGTMNVLTDQSPDPGERVIRLSFFPISNEDATTIGIVATEVTQLFEAEKALEKSEASLQSVSAQLLQVQDDERRRLARDLHDTTGQELSVVIMSLDRVAKEQSGCTDEDRKALVYCTQQLRKVENDIRTLSYVLHPPLLDEMGIGVALRWYLDGFSKRTEIQVDAEIPDSVPRFELEKETALFRVIQESLTNVYRHSGSPRARVRVLVEPSSIKAFVEDQGHGFKTDVSAKPKSGVGIQSMKGRLQIVGGDLTVRSHPSGTTVVASVPIERRKGSDASSNVVASSSAETKSVRKRILIVDDHYVARRGIRTLFDDVGDLEICGEAADGIEAVRQAKELKPDLVIMDLSMPKMGGLAAAVRIRDARLETRILVYTSHSVPQLERNIRLAGCDGYVVKSNASNDLLRATREILGGGKFYLSEMTSGKSA